MMQSQHFVICGKEMLPNLSFVRGVRQPVKAQFMLSRVVTHSFSFGRLMRCKRNYSVINLMHLLIFWR